MDATIAAAPKADHGKLLKILGVGFGIAIAIGGAIGSGILRNPGIVADKLGSAWLVLAAWSLGGVFSLIGANTYAELSTAMTVVGMTDEDFQSDVLSLALFETFGPGAAAIPPVRLV